MAAKRRYTLENREVATSHSQRFLRSFRTSLEKLVQRKISMLHGGCFQIIYLVFYLAKSLGST